MEYISKSENDTFEIAKKFAFNLVAGDIVLLQGDLGAGKTVFVKGIVKTLGGNKDLVTSPTFTIVNDYQTKNGTIYHFDLYRIKSEEELYNIGIEEYLYSDAISFVEWPERAPDLFGKTCKKIIITKVDENTRKIEF